MRKLAAATSLRSAWTRAELAAVIDHTLLDPAATTHDVLMALGCSHTQQVLDSIPVVDA